MGIERLLNFITSFSFAMRYRIHLPQKANTFMSLNGFALVRGEDCMGMTLLALQRLLVLQNHLDATRFSCRARSNE